MSESMSEIAARRAKRRKAAKLRRLKFLTIVFLVVALIVVSILSVTVFFPIKSIKVTGTKKYNEQTIIESSRLSGKNLIITSEKKLEERLRKKFPYIDSITLKKQMPDTITIKIIDAKEYAAYLISGKYYVVSKKGYVLKISNTIPKGAFEVITEAKKAEPGNILEFKDKETKQLTYDIIEYLGEYNIKINSVNVKSKSKITVRIEDRFDVSFGTDSYLKKKCAHLASMLKKIEEDAQGDIDLSMWTPKKREGTFVRKTAEEISAKLLEFLSKNDVTIDNVDASDVENISARVDGRFSVNFGDDSYLKEKCDYLAEIIEGINEGGSIDLSKWTPQNLYVNFEK